MHNIFRPSFCLLAVFLAGCATSSTIRKDDRVSIILKNGTRIQAEITDILNNEIKFEAIDKKKAFDYGEKIPIGRVRGIQMPEGEVVSVKEYRALLGGDRLRISSRRPPAKTRARTRASSTNSYSQYEEIKNKPIAEMTDNEFKFFMMMKEKELESQDSDSRSERAVQPAFKLRNEMLDELVDSIIDAGLAAGYLSFLKDKFQREGLSSFETKIMSLIERHPRWREQLDRLQPHRKG